MAPVWYVLIYIICFHVLSVDGSLMQTLDDDAIELTEEKKFIPCITPSHVLLFATGATNIPSVGFEWWRIQ